MVHNIDNINIQEEPLDKFPTFYGSGREFRYHRYFLFITIKNVKNQFRKLRIK